MHVKSSLFTAVALLAAILLLFGACTTSGSQAASSTAKPKPAPVRKPNYEEIPGGKRITSNQTGVDGMWYTFWTEGSGSVAMDLLGGGHFKLVWKNTGNFVCGKGWGVGKPRTITWTGTATGAQYFGVYGWMTKPLVEYYIPRTGGKKRGTYTADGTTYTLYTNTRVNQPSIMGTATFEQYFCHGKNEQKVNFAEHMEGWKSIGMPVGRQHYQVVAVEGWGGSSGSADVTVSGE